MFTSKNSTILSPKQHPKTTPFYLQNCTSLLPKTIPFYLQKQYHFITKTAPKISHVYLKK